MTLLALLPAVSPSTCATGHNFITTTFFDLPTLASTMTESPGKTGVVDSTKEDQQSQSDLVNASGHRQELPRNYSLLSICALAITTGNTWIAQGGSVATALYNGGPSGVIYEFMAVSVCYWMVAASIAELASGMPSAGGGMCIALAVLLKLT